MKNRFILLTLSIVLISAMVLASCSKSTTTTTSSTAPASTTTTKTTTTTTNTTTLPPTSTTKTTAASGNWWDKLGTPQYGGEMVIRSPMDIVFFDPYQGETLMSFMWGWEEQLFATDWKIDPSVQSYQLSFWDNSFARGQLITSWEFTSPGVYVMHVRPGIHWQNIAPANGREFVADDIVFHFNRMLGLGSGFSKPAPYWGTVAWTKSITSVTATDKYTVVINWSTLNPEFVNENLEAPGASTTIENPEAVKQWGDVVDWHHAVGTGPFILTDFVSGSSMTMVRNPNYYQTDERYPKNQLPYLDSIRALIIPDNATAIAAMRTGKIDLMDSMPLATALQVKKSNPSIVQVAVPQGVGVSMDPRNDMKPFSDIRVRIACQEAINLPEIAATYYGGTVDASPLSLTSANLVGWGWPYAQWPQSLKDEYAYNPTNAKKLLADAGFPNGLKCDIYLDSQADKDLTQIVKSYFLAVGIDMEIKPLDAATFASFVNAAHKNTAFVIRNSGALALAFYPLRHLLRYGTGQPANAAMVAGFDHFYNDALAATSVDGVKKIVQAANEDVARNHYSVSLLCPMNFNFCQPWLKGFNAQYGSFAGTNGPFFLFEYGARWWIDQSVKKSMGF